MVGVCARGQERRAAARARTSASALTNMGSVPLRATAVEEALRGQPLSAETIAAGGRAGGRGHRSARRTSTPAPTTSATSRGCCTRRALEEAAGAVSIGEVTVAQLADRVRRGGERRARRRRATSPTGRWRWRSTLRSTLEQPLLLEGEAGVGKTEVARALAAATGARLIRLQCHEGIDLHHAVYDWDYPRQLLALRAAEGGVDEGELFARRFLLRRPLLEALEADGEPVVLLIDEIDRADDEFEAFLLEFLSDFAVTIPELGTVTARRRPVVVLTSNRTRELHDALKRRCLYHWIDYPTPERERADRAGARCPACPSAIADAGRRGGRRGCASRATCTSCPGVGETIVWAQALLALGDGVELEETLGAALKVHEDVLRVREREVLEGV